MRIIEEYHFLVFQKKCITGALKKMLREIVESKLEDGQCGFRPGRSTTGQIFTLGSIFEKFLGYAKDVFACFVDPEKAYDRILRDKLWRVLQEYGIDGHLLMAIKSLYCQAEVSVLVNDKQSKSFQVSVGLRQGCVLSPFLLISYMKWMECEHEVKLNR